MRDSNSEAVSDAAYPARNFWSAAIFKVLLFPFVALPYLLAFFWDPIVLSAWLSDGLVLVSLAILVLIISYARKSSENSCVFLFPLIGLAMTIGAVLARTRTPLIFYPSVLTGTVAWGFMRTLRNGETPLVERFAIRREKVITPLIRRYCRIVTIVWGAVLAFSAMMGTVSWLISPDFWKIYNGCLAYVLFAAVFIFEYGARLYVRSRNS